MPLNLNARSVSRFDDRPLHRQLADAIRAQIESGELWPGEALPSEREISDLTGGLSRTTVREALDLLTGEGLTIKRSGAATRVAIPPTVRHVSTERYAAELALLRELGGRDHPPTSAFTVDHGVDWAHHRIDANYTKGAAGEGDAERLGIAPGTPVLRRRLIKYIGSEPVQLQTSVLPLRLVAGTPVADPARQPWPGGTVAELWSIGLAATRVVEEAQARMPSSDERRKLEMSAGPVLEVTRTFWVADEIGAEGPAEASVVVVPAARMILRFDTTLS